MTWLATDAAAENFGPFSSPFSGIRSSGEVWREEGGPKAVSSLANANRICKVEGEGSSISAKEVGDTKVGPSSALRSRQGT